MQARVIVLGPARGIDSLTYAIPAEMDGRVECGHRVVVPVRSRKLTGVVVEVGADLDAGGAALKPLLEILEPRPLFDRPHLELRSFLASYYLVPLAEAYQSVVPAVARVESRHTLKLERPPAPLELAALNALERAIVDALARRPMTQRQLQGLGKPREVAAAVNRLSNEGFVGRQEGTRGRHRALAAIVRLKDGADPKAVRGPKQRAILSLLRQLSSPGLDVEELEEEIPGAKAALKTLAKRGVIEIAEAADRDACDSIGPALEPNEEQEVALHAIAPAIDAPRFEAFLLWGITASGKTEVYLQLAARCLAAGRQALVMVPEIALADQIVRSFRSRFGARVAVAHSAQQIAERWASWRAAMSGQARIMIGPRSAIFAPLHDLGLIVVDEEHDPAYKQEDGIRYHARDLAVALGRFSRCPVVLGSATPSAESFANARRGRYRMLQLSRRVQDRPLAAVEVIDLRAEFKRAASAAPGSDRTAPGYGAVPKTPAPVPLSEPLIQALRETLSSGGQSIIFLNRRGYHNFLQCHLCGAVITCPNCSVSMTFHLHDRSLRCHYCGNRAPAPDHCPECRGFGLSGQGFGTEKLVDALKEIAPRARIERMDSDTSGRKGARSAIVDALMRGEIDVLVGTQMITKGFDLPGVTLVGVVLADLALNLPDFRSAERTFQLLTQVAGRAGRGERPGKVLIQTYAPHHYSIRAAREQDYARFIRRELTLRRELKYPPYARMAMVRIEGVEPSRVQEIATKVATVLGRAVKDETTRVLGPAPAPIERIKQRYRWQVVVKSGSLTAMRQALIEMRAQVAPLADRHEVRLLLDIDPVNML
jgi:primosomal protein N' (replication factor Y) (superfamily II helicase)